MNICYVYTLILLLFCINSNNYNIKRKKRNCLKKTYLTVRKCQDSLISKIQSGKEKIEINL